jgi:hypothetical protein
MTLSRKLLVLLLALQIAVAPVFAHPNFGRNREDSQAQTAQAAAQAAFNMDLTSTVKALDASNLGINRGVNINVGGVMQRVTSQDMLTPAEYLAASQVLATSVQSLRVAADGTAYRGHFSLPESVTQSLSNLVIPEGVKFVQDFGSQAALNMTGDLNNSGRFFAFSSNPQVLAGIVNANNIYNNQGAVITSLLAHGDLPTGVNVAVANLDLTLNAAGQIVNQGTIASSGNLSLNAGGGIVNALSSGMQAATTPTLFASNNLALQSPSIVNQGLMAAQSGNLNALTASLTNSGVMQALAGSISVQNVVGNTLTIDNTNGAMSALTAISFQTLPSVYETPTEIKPDSELLNASCSCAPSDQMHEALQEMQKVLLSRATLTLNGGDLSAPQVDFISDHGDIKIHANRIDGTVNVTAYKIYLQSDVGDLNTGTLNLTGDPIFLSNGNLTLNLPWVNGGFWTRGEEFVALAGGDINMGPHPAYATIDTTSIFPCLSFGGRIDIQAGVTFTKTGTVTGTTRSGGNVNMGDVQLRGHNTINVVAHEGDEPGKGIVQIGEIDGELPSCIDPLIQQEEDEDANVPDPNTIPYVFFTGQDFGSGAGTTPSTTPTSGSTLSGTGGNLNISAVAGTAIHIRRGGDDAPSQAEKALAQAAEGQNGATGNKGADGRPGQDFTLTLSQPYGTYQILTIDTSGGNGQPGQDGQAGGNGKLGTTGITLPLAFTGGSGGSGGTGGNGGRGGDGGAGGKGGDAGKINISLNSPALFITSINASGGLGARGGSGGAGGVGGKGGDGGSGILGESFGTVHGKDIASFLQATFLFKSFLQHASDIFGLVTGTGNFENALTVGYLKEQSTIIKAELRAATAALDKEVARIATDGPAIYSKLSFSALRAKPQYATMTDAEIMALSTNLTRHMDLAFAKRYLDRVGAKSDARAKLVELEAKNLELPKSYTQNRQQDAVGLFLGFDQSILEEIISPGYIPGGVGGSGGPGGPGGKGGDGGTSGKGGNGGNGGNVTLTNTGRIVITAGIIDASGGHGGDAGVAGAGGVGGQGGFGGLGGFGGNGGRGLDASPYVSGFTPVPIGVNALATEPQPSPISLLAFGGGSPAQDGLPGGRGGDGGAGGKGGDGGKNGDGGSGGNGGKAGNVVITASSLTASFIDVSGGDGGNGGISLSGFNIGGPGGRGGIGGNGGNGGWAGQGGFFFHGGTGGDGGIGGAGGVGGNGGTGGGGGNGGNAGAGGPAGSVTLNVPKIKDKLEVNLNGGVSGKGGAASAGGAGGIGGTGGDGGKGGRGQVGGNNNIAFNAPLLFYMLAVVSIPTVMTAGASFSILGTGFAASAFGPGVLSPAFLLATNWHHGGGSGGDGGLGGRAAKGGNGGDGGLGGVGGNTYTNGAMGSLSGNTNVIRVPASDFSSPVVGKGAAGGAGGKGGANGKGGKGGAGGAVGQESFFGLSTFLGLNFKTPGQNGVAGRSPNEIGSFGVTHIADPAKDGIVLPNPLNPVALDSENLQIDQNIVDTGDDADLDEISQDEPEPNVLSMVK